MSFLILPVYTFSVIMVYEFIKWMITPSWKPLDFAILNRTGMVYMIKSVNADVGTISFLEYGQPPNVAPQTLGLQLFNSLFRKVR